MSDAKTAPEWLVKVEGSEGFESTLDRYEDRLKIVRRQRNILAEQCARLTEQSCERCGEMAALVAKASGLAAEVRGFVGAYNDTLRSVAGNTNVSVLEHHEREVTEALANLATAAREHDARVRREALTSLGDEMAVQLTLATTETEVKLAASVVLGAWLKRVQRPRGGRR